MRDVFSAAADKFTEIRMVIGEDALSLFDDHWDGVTVLAARADQVDALYAYASSWEDGTANTMRRQTREG